MRLLLRAIPIEISPMTLKDTIVTGRRPSGTSSTSKWHRRELGRANPFHIDI